MWIWHTQTTSVRCESPLLTLEVVHIDCQLKVTAHGAVEELRNYSSNAKTLGELLVCLDKWLEEHNLTASGIVGSECKSLLDEKLDWVTDSFLISEQIRGESLVFVIQAGNAEKFLPDDVINDSLPKYESRNHLLIDEQTLKEINKVVTQGLEIRQKLDIDHLVVSVPMTVCVNADELVNSWLYCVKTLFPQGFLMKSHNWDLISCTPERFISIADSKLQVQILAGTFQNGKDFDKSSLMNEHQAARNDLQSIVENVVGKLELTVDSDLLAFDEITHFHSMFEKPYHSDTSMLSTLAHLTPSPATGTHDNHVQFVIKQLEGRTRGYYGGCFFLRTPGCLESLVSIRSIFHLEKSEVGEMIVGGGLKKGSTLSSESTELISKATSCAKLLGVKLGK
ncbi:MAG: chorismate-binding protein [Brasilonema angustatum HA4187-MV1]|nr:chorismate-binding protein [Brasilonema angustatum HA4187-MV1]